MLVDCNESLWRCVTVVNRYDLLCIDVIQSFGGSTFHTQNCLRVPTCGKWIPFQHPSPHTVNEVQNSPENCLKYYSVIIGTWISVAYIVTFAPVNVCPLYWVISLSTVIFLQFAHELWSQFKGQKPGEWYLKKRKICRNPKIWKYFVPFLVEIVCINQYCILIMLSVFSITVSFVCSFSEMNSQTWPIQNINIFYLWQTVRGVLLSLYW